MGPVKLSATVGFYWRAGHFLKRKLDQRIRKSEPPLLNPVTPKEAAATLLNASQDHIFFDVFDTLVQRTVRPEHTKIIACQHLVTLAGLVGIEGRSLYDIRRDLEARLCHRQYDENGELEFLLPELSRHLYDKLHADGRFGFDCSQADFGDLLSHCELLAEKSVLTPMKTMISALEQAASNGKICTLVSDSYLPAPFIRELLAPFGILDHTENLFVSCEEMASKRSGRLYNHVLEHLGVDASDVLMVGDNIWSDIRNARTRGINTLYLTETGQQAFYDSRESKVTDTGVLKRRYHAILLSNANNATSDFRALAAPLLLFTMRLYRVLRQNNRRHLFFLAREGQVLERLFNLYQDALDVPDKYRINTHYLRVSRRATYIASLRPLAQEDFSLLFMQYRLMSLADFLQSLRFPEMLIKELADELKTTPDQTYDDFPTSSCYNALIKNKNFTTNYEKLRVEQKANLNDYVRGFCVDFSEHYLTLVDVGWKGTIQDNLRNALPGEIDIEGFYLGLIAPGRDVSGKKGILFSNQEQLISHFFGIFAENRSLFEIFLPADHGSALNYVRQLDGTIRVELEEHDDESSFVGSTVMPVVKEIIVAFEQLLSMILCHAPKEAELEDIVASIHAQSVLSPSAAQLRWLTQSHHRENFGLFINSRFGEAEEQSLTGRLKFFKSLLRNPRQEILGSFWPYYTLRTKGGAPLAVAYRWGRLGQARWHLYQHTNRSGRS